jgi:hypothetical protein
MNINSKKMVVISNLEEVFDANQMPKISIEDYLKRLITYLKPDLCSLIISLVYLDKLNKKVGILLRPENIHKLLLISLVAAIKFNEDVAYSNLIMAEVGGLKVNIFNKLELEFLKMIEFSLYVDDSVFLSYQNHLINF